MTWDEENRLMGINDNGRIHQYTYDAGGERVIKSSGDSQHIAVNGQTAATIVHTDDYTGYVSPYFVISKGKFTKHYFEGAGRIVSKLGNGSFAQPLKLTAGGVNYTQRTAEEQKAMDAYVKTLGVPPGPATQQGIYATPEFTGDPYPSDAPKPVEENQEPPEGWPRNPVFNKAGDVPGPPVQFGPPVQPTTVAAGEGFTGIGLPENDIFYFHPDHLGSTSYITTKNGSISQHVEYIAFGEILFEEHSSSFSSPYLFNGKELDRETNLSYYGARYLDMKTSLWLNVDPLKEKYPSVGAYVYALNNPIMLVDPDGRSVINGDQPARDDAANKQQQAQANFDSKANGYDKKTATKNQKAEYKLAKTNLNEATKIYKAADKKYQHTQNSIDNFRNVDRASFDKMDNLKNGVTGENIDVVVSTADSSINGGGKTIIKSPDANNNIVNGIINSYLDPNTAIDSDVLAHEFGHVEAYSLNPAAYFISATAAAKIEKYSCQDYENHSNEATKNAHNWQTKYRTDYRKYKKKIIKK